MKTRLSPPLSPEEAAELYRCMLLDTIAKVRSLPDLHKVLFYQEEPIALQYFQEVAPDFILEPQKGCNLGERMADAFRMVFSLGHRQVAIIGTDSPDLPVDYLSGAFHELSDESVDVVFGPTEDGGYYLLAMKQTHACLFEGIAWSTETVLGDSLSRADEAGLRVKLLPAWHDVDRYSDLQRNTLIQEKYNAPLTRAFLLKLT